MNNVVDIQRGIAQLDQEKEAAEALERNLKPYNLFGVPYNREAVIQVLKNATDAKLKVEAVIGMGLVLLEEHESATTLRQILEEHFSWITPREYQRSTRFARFCAKSAKFMALFGQRGMMNKGLALLSSLSDPEIDELLMELEETGEVKGLSEADLLGKTYRQMVLENKRLRLDLNHKVEAATEKFQKENLRLKKQNEELREEAGQLPGLEKEIAKLDAAGALINEAVSALGRPDWVLLSKEAGGRARAKLLIDKLGRVAQWLGELIDPVKAK